MDRKKIEKLTDYELVAEVIEVADAEDELIIDIVRYFKWRKRLSEKQRNLLINWLSEWKFAGFVMRKNYQSRFDKINSANRDIKRFNRLKS